MFSCESLLLIFVILMGRCSIIMWTLIVLLGLKYWTSNIINWRREIFFLDKIFLRLKSLRFRDFKSIFFYTKRSLNLMVLIYPLFLYRHIRHHLLFFLKVIDWWTSKQHQLMLLTNFILLCRKYTVFFYGFIKDHNLVVIIFKA